MLDEKTYSRYFKAFGDPSRLRILSLLSEGEMTVNDVAAKVGLSQPTVSRHLAILRNADIVIDRREGQKVIYKLNISAVEDCCTGFCDCLTLKVVRRKKKSK